MLTIKNIQFDKLEFMKVYLNVDSSLLFYFKYLLNDFYVLVEIKTKFNDNDNIISYINYYIQAQYISNAIPLNKEVKYDIYYYEDDKYKLSLNDRSNFFKFEKTFISEYNLYKYHTFALHKDLDITKLKDRAFRKNKIKKILSL